MSFNVRMSGLPEMQRRLGARGRVFVELAATALYQEGEVEMAEAVRRTPVDTGVLRSTGIVDGPTVAGGRITVELAFGGPAAPYAEIVHEDLEAFHPVGEAKYLEGPLRESAPFMGERLARRMEQLAAGSL